MTLLYIDLETIPVQDPNLSDFVTSNLKPPSNYKTKVAIDKWFFDNSDVAIEKTSFDGTFGQICTIAWAFDDGKINSVQRTGDCEKELIESFFIEITPNLSSRDHQIKPTWIAHNKEFDLRFLFLRSIILGVNNQGFKIPVNDRYNNESFCTMQAWKGFGAKPGGTLKAICKVLDINCKEGMSGADVWPAYQNGEFDKIQEYCMDDVRALREVYNRIVPYI